MSFWFTIVVALVSAALATLATVSGGILGAPTAIKGMLFLISGVIIGCIWSLAMAAIALAIVTDSSEGSDEIQNWPTSVFMDWLTDLIAFLVALLVSAFPGWLIAKVSSAPVDETALFIGASVLACLPIVVLSQLAHDSMFAVLSPGILGSWFRCPLSWFGFWLHAAAVAGLVGGAAYLAFFVSGWFILLFGPLAVAGLIYYCRVMGRLAWVIAETSPEVGDEEDESSAR